MIIITYIMTALSIIGTVANSFRRKWCFYLWAVTNTFWCVYNFAHEEYALAIQYAFNFAMAVVGLIRWSREERKEKEQRKVDDKLLNAYRRLGQALEKHNKYSVNFYPERQEEQNSEKRP